MRSEHTTTWEELAELIAGGNGMSVQAYLDTLPPAETARAVSRLDEEQRSRLLILLSPEGAAEVLRDLPGEQAADLIEEIPARTAAAIVDELPPDEQADLLGDMDEGDAQAILEEMPGEDAEQARELLRYPGDTAGGLMTTEFLSYPRDTTVDAVLTDLETHAARYADYQIQYLYITDPGQRLVGVLRLRDLLLSPRNRTIAEGSIIRPVHVHVLTALQPLVQVFDEHPFMGIPVVDDAGRLEGVVERTAVLEAWGNREKDIFLRISGIVGGEEFRSMPLPLRSFRRLSWLGPNILLNIIAASVIAAYQDTLQAAIALAVFLPIISDMSGCSGNQAVAVSIRELALGLIKPGELARVLWKESSVGTINGLLLGTILGGVAYIWTGRPVLALVVGSALAINTAVSVLLGGTVPLLLRKIGVDPALASGPILTTVTDMCGFFLVLSMATAALAHLA